LAVRLDHGTFPLAPAGDGVFAATVPAAAGDLYRYVLDDRLELPDPCSRSQPHGVGGPSQVVDPRAFAWHDSGWPGRPIDELVLYELHVGTFTPEGTFGAIAPRLAGLRELGVTAIELMPVATFPGARGWGYDSVFNSAPHAVYGGPEGLARLVDAAHQEEMAVILDVVYNHIGHGGEAFASFGPYFGARLTEWGPAPDFDGPAAGPVREWAIQDACRWVRDYHVDGFRIDAAHAIGDRSTPHLVAELGGRVRAATERHVLVTVEGEPDDPRLASPPESWEADAWWADSFHHALHAALTGERDGYYRGFGSMASLARELERPVEPRLVVYAQNHDQVGNRAEGDRLPAHLQRLAALCTVLSPFQPLLFMGEEYGERRPFAFFTDHSDPALAEAARSGRRREFAAFHGFDGPLPDPQAPDTFGRSKLHPEGGDPELVVFYRELLALRRQIPSGPARVAYDDEARWLRVARGPFEIVCNFSPGRAPAPATGRTILLATSSAVLETGQIVLDAWSGALLSTSAPATRS
jgi:maltooligosyltrehalose trehalohydrolase